MDFLGEYGRPILSLLVVFSLLGFTVWKLGRNRGSLSLARLGKAFAASKGRSEERLLEPLERLALTPQHTLHVLRLRDREILVATHPQGCSLLHRSEGIAAQAAKGAGA